MAHATQTLTMVKSSLRHRADWRGQRWHVTRYRDADMALRWTPAGFIEAQKPFRKIQSIKDLWILKAALGGQKTKLTLTNRYKLRNVSDSTASCTYQWDIAF